jgi:MFS family permease
MRRTLLTLSSLLLGFFLLQMSNGLQGTLLAVRADMEGFGATAAGLVMSGLFAGMALGSILAGRIIEHVGHVRTFAALASTASAAALVHLAFVDPVAWVVVRAVTGFCFAGLIVVVESWLNASVASAERGRLLSIYAMVGLAAGVTGQLLFDVADPAGYLPFVIVSIAMSLALVPSTLSQATAPVPEIAQDPPSVRRLWRISPFGTVAMAMAGATVGTFFGLAPVFFQRIGFSPSDIAVLMAAGTFGGLALQFPLGALSDRVDRRWVCIGTALAAVLVTLGLTTLPVPSLAVSVGLAALLGGVLLPTMSLVVAHVNDRAPPAALLAASGGLVLMQGIGAASGPFIGGALMDLIGPRGLLLVLAGIQAVIVGYALYRIVVHKGIEPDERADYAPLTLTPVEGELELAPR